MKKIKEMNKTEKRAWREVKNAFEWVVGGYENSVCDGHIEEMPTYEELVEEIYWTVMNCTTEPGYQSCTPCEEVRFAGKEFIMECINHKMEKGEFQYEVKHEVVEEVEEEQAKPAEKTYWSVVRCKTNIKAQPFILMCLEARNKKHAEDILFDTNFAPYGNKIFTEEQLMKVDVEWLNKVGISGKEELAHLVASSKEGKVTA